MSIREPINQSDAASPQSVNICLNCTRPTCSGVCDAFPKQAPPSSRASAAYEYNGESHSLPEWADLLGIKYATLHKRLRSGMSFAEALQYGITGRRNVHRYTIGSESHTLKEWAAITGVPYSTIVQRLAHGVDIEYAIRRELVKHR